MSNITVISGVEVRQDAEGRYSLNDLHKASGGENRHRPSLWAENQQVQALVSEIQSEAGIPALVSVKGGSASGTYVCKELVYAYAMWISPAFHLKVIRAYDAQVVQPQFNIPQSLPEALRLAADLADQNKALEGRIQEQAPKVEAHDRMSEATTTLCIRDAAKTLQVQPSYLTNWLITEKWMYHRPGKSGYLAYQDRIQSGHLIHKSHTYHHHETGEDRISEQVRVTGRGLTLIAQRLNEAGVSMIPVQAKRKGDGTLPKVH